MKNKKTCTKCKKEKNIKEFWKDKRSKDKLYYLCKQCANKQKKEYRKNNKEEIKKQLKIYYQKNKDKILNSQKKYEENHKEERQKYRQKYYQENREEKLKQRKERYQQNKEKELKQAKKYRQKHKSKRRQYQQEYRKKNRRILNGKRKIYVQQKLHQNPILRLKSNISRRLRWHLKKINVPKNGQTTLNLLGYTLADLEKHMKQCEGPCKLCGKPFSDNFHIDHIKPLSLATTKEEVVELFQLDNLRYLCGPCNLKKSNKYQGENYEMVY